MRRRRSGATLMDDLTDNGLWGMALRGRVGSQRRSPLKGGFFVVRRLLRFLLNRIYVDRIIHYVAIRDSRLGLRDLARIRMTVWFGSAFVAALVFFFEIVHI